MKDFDITQPLPDDWFEASFKQSNDCVKPMIVAWPTTPSPAENLIKANLSYAQREELARMGINPDRFSFKY